MSSLGAHPHEWGTTDGTFTMKQEQEYCDWLEAEAKDAHTSYIFAGALGDQTRADELWARYIELTDQLGDHTSVCS
jgi:hypothetical protein